MFTLGINKNPENSYTQKGEIIMNAKKSLSTLITAILMLSMVLAITPIAKAVPSISLSPNEGEPGTLVTVRGLGFTPGASGRVWFDVNGNGAHDTGEPITSAAAADDGSFTVTLIVPTVSVGTYYIRADVPSGGPVEASVPFSVVALIVDIRTRATEYSPGDLITISGSATTPIDFGFTIRDPNGVLFYSADITAGQWIRVGATYVLPYIDSLAVTLPSDAPTGVWNFTAYNLATGARISMHLFNVVPRATVADVSRQIEQLSNAITQLQGVITQLQNSINAMGEQLGAIKGAADSAVSAANAAKSAADSAASAAQNLVSIAQNAVSAANAAKSAADNAASAANAAKSAADNAASAANAAKSAADNAVNTAQSAVSAANAAKSAADNAASAACDAAASADAAKSAAEGVVLPVWIAVVLSLVAAVAAIVAVITIRGKIAG